MFRQKRIQHTQGKRSRKGKKHGETWKCSDLGSFRVWTCVWVFSHLAHEVLVKEFSNVREGMALQGLHEKRGVGKASTVYFELQVLVSLDECFSRFLLSLSLLFKLDHVLNSKIQWQSSSHKACQSFVVKLKAQNPTLFLFFLAGYHHHHKYQYQLLFLFFFLSPFSLSLSLASP